MKTVLYGDGDAPFLLVQPAGGHDPAGIESEAAEIRRLAGGCFCLAAVEVDSWNRDLSPWEAPPAFGKEGFGSGAGSTLDGILELCAGSGKICVIGGYSLAGLFALWAAYQTDRFAGVAAASPSVWFPGFTDYMRERPVRTGAVCLSLGDREEKTGNPVLAAVGGRIREAEEILKGQGVNCTLEWNPGNHFREPDLRTARVFARVLNEIRNGKRSGAG